MRGIEWWEKLGPDDREWLIAHNGEAVDPQIVRNIEAVGGLAEAHASWIGSDGPEGFFLSDEAVDWIEAVANDEPS